METITESMDDKVSQQPTDSKLNENKKGMVKGGNLEYEFSKEKMAELGARVRLTDKDEATGLELYCYINCNPTDKLTLHQCRGVVFKGNTVIMRAFPYTMEFGTRDETQINECFKDNFSECKFYDAHEGALIRMFYFDSKWFTCTHRKLNAFRSKWASRESFGTAFKRALEAELTHNKKLSAALPHNDESLLERFQSTLDKDKQYMFLVRHSVENRIVCKAPPEPKVYHVGTFVKGQLIMSVDCHLDYPKQYNFTNVSELLQHVKDTDICQLQGIICFTPNNKQIKIMHKDYLELFKARGNEPSIKFRYLQIRMNRRMVDMLHHLYPELSPVFEDIENNIYEISKNIYQAYIHRFIKKKFVTVPTEDFAVIRECHKWHEENRVNNRISNEKVINVLNQQSATNINRMLRRFRIENNQKFDQQKLTQHRSRSNTVPSTPESSPPTSTVHNGHKLSPLSLPKKIQLSVAV